MAILKAGAKVRLLDGSMGTIESYQGDGFYRVIVETDAESIEQIDLPIEDLEIITEAK